MPPGGAKHGVTRERLRFDAEQSTAPWKTRVPTHRKVPAAQAIRSTVGSSSFRVRYSHRFPVVSPASDPHATGVRDDRRSGEVCRVGESRAQTIIGAMTSDTVLMSLMMMSIAGPAVSLNGSPTVSPMTAAL